MTSSSNGNNGHTSGSYNQRIYLDLVDEAMRLAGKPGARANRTIAAMAERQLRLLERAMRQFKRLLYRETRASELWVPSPDTAKSMAQLSDAINRTWREMRSARKDEQAALAGLSEEDIDRVLTANLIRVARELIGTEHQRVMLTQWYGREAADKLMGIGRPPEESLLGEVIQ